MAAINLTDTQAQALITQWQNYPQDWPHFLMALIDVGLVGTETDAQVIADISVGPPIVSTDTSANT